MAGLEFSKSPVSRGLFTSGYAASFCATANVKSYQRPYQSVSIRPHLNSTKQLLSGAKVHGLSNRYYGFTTLIFIAEMDIPYRLMVPQVRGIT